MELTLQPEEAALLERILTNYLADLRMEISGTDLYELRQSLKHDEVLIKDLIARLQRQIRGAEAAPKTA